MRFRGPSSPVARTLTRGLAIPVALAVVCGPASLAAAQTPRPAAASPVVDLPASGRVDVRVLPNGRLRAAASDVPLDKVIAGVAAAAGLRVFAVGAIPQPKITVLFDSKPATEILNQLMNPAGISYLQSGSAANGTGRLIMYVFDPKSDAPRQAAALASAPASTLPAASAGTTREILPMEQPAVAANDRPASAPPAAPMAWPTNVQPVNSGAVALPTTREELMLQVNGSPAVSYPAGVVPPGMGPMLKPEQIEPVNRPAAAGTATTARPGMPTAVPASVVNPGGTPPPVDPTMMKAPETISIPGPTVVYFPPPQDAR